MHNIYQSRVHIYHDGNVCPTWVTSNGITISQFLCTQKDSILEGKVCIEHVIFWWKTRSCAEKGRPRPHVNGCYSCISLHSIDNLNNWAFVVVRYDPMICCVLHARVHPAERHQPTSPPSPWLLARNSSKGLAPVYSMQVLRAQDWKDWHYSL